MTEPRPVAEAELLDRLPLIWPDPSLRAQIASRLRSTHGCIVALDDDPTGSQAVHDVWVVCRPRAESLRPALQADDPALFILTNSRSLPEAEARELSRRLGREALRIGETVGRSIQLVSRSDSTLRGHFPAEVDALSESYRQQAGTAYDGVILVPYFGEGGRYTIDDVHWVEQGELLVPAGQTPYARDHAFGYHASRLPEYIEEKSRGRISATSVLSIPIDRIRTGGPQAVAQDLAQAHSGRIVVANAAHERDLEVLVVAVLAAELNGQRFLYRSAAPLVKVAAGIADRRVLTRDEVLPGRSDSGALVVFGSIVPRSSAQLEPLLGVRDVVAIELDVAGLIDESAALRFVQTCVQETDEALAKGRDVILHTTREPAVARTPEEALRTGQTVSSRLCAIASRLRERPRYVLGKGGITASDLATQALHVERARVLGQVLPGVSVWRLGPEALWPDLSYIIFPGNVGAEHSVADLVLSLR